MTLGQTYTFERISGSHPFAIMDNTAQGFIGGSDGAYFRTSTDSTEITNAILTPNVDFIATPNSANIISWTPNELGDFWYTCTVAGHINMTGLITVVPEPSAYGAIAGVFALIALGRRRGLRSRQG